MNFSLLKRCNMFTTVAFHHSLLISSCAQADLSFRLEFKARGYFPKILCCVNVASFVFWAAGARRRVVFYLCYLP